MKKTLLAAALLAGFATAGVAQAETSVTLYGILDTGYGYGQVKYDRDGSDYKSTNSGMYSGVFNGNRFGMRGSEDLGDGLRAIFTLEQGFNLGNGEQYGDRQFHRQAWVGLASDNWGTFTMGRQYNMGAKFVYDNFNYGVASGDFDNGFGSLGYGNRMDNSFRYITPNFGGFSLGLAYGNGDTNITRDGWEYDSKTSTYKFSDDDGERTNWTSVGAQYVNGPIAIGASYDRQNTNGGDNALTAWALGASYDFEVVKVALVYGQDRHGKMAGGSAPYSTEFSAKNSASLYRSDFKSNNYHVGLRAPVAGGNLNISWTGSNSNLDESSAFTAQFGEKTQNNYAISYQYPLSKRTSVYAYGGYTTGYAYIDGMKAGDAGIGLNHKF